MQLIHALAQQVVAGLALGTAHELSGAGHQQIHCGHGLSIVVLVHVESLDILGPVIDENGALEIRLGQVFLVLLGQILPILGLKLELLLGLAQDGNGFLMGEPGPRRSWPVRAACPAGRRR